MSVGMESRGRSGVGGFTPQLQAATAREATQLERHCHELAKLEELLTGAVNRTRSIADRLIGSEPEPGVAGRNGLGNEINVAAVPMVVRLEREMQAIGAAAQQLHYQLDRLERF